MIRESDSIRGVKGQSEDRRRSLRETFRGREWVGGSMQGPPPLVTEKRGVAARHGPKNQAEAGGQSGVRQGGVVAGRVSHIHTLRVEAGHQRVLQVAGVSQELLGCGAGRRL